MQDWLDKMGHLIDDSEDDITTTKPKHSLLLSRPNITTAAHTHALLPKTPSVSYAQNRSESISSNLEIKSDPQPESSVAMKSQSSREDEDLKALKRLRELPRGSNVDSRVAAIKNLLGETEIYKTLKMLRWPQGVVCPTCLSANVVRRDPPPEAIDKRHFYVCLNCKGEGNPSDFDDLTGLPIDDLQSVRQWVLCWYLIGFCSMSQIAKALGLSLNEVLQIAHQGSDLAQLPDDSKIFSAEARLDASQKKSKEAKRRSEIDTQEDYTRSASKSPHKPGYKSKK